ncbi:MAG: monooxygenase [Burkholderiaceae bacterium]
MEPRTMFGRVVVAGAGIAGLLAARVLLDHADEVVLVEPDRISDRPDLPRPGVPQGHHAHALLASGQRAIEALLPGLSAALGAQGAPSGGGTFFTAGGYLDTGAADASLYASRALLEGALRRVVVAHHRLRLIEGCSVAVPLLRSDRITGVRIAASAGDSIVDLAADLLVDASGARSQTAAWLATHGFAAPPVERVDVGIRYASRYLKRDRSDLGGRMFFSVSPSPVQRRACGVLAQEGDRWIVTLIGYFGDQPPLDDAGFAAFARTFPVPEVADLIERAQPLGPIRGYAFAADRRLHYERAARLPDGLLVIGDALANFSPVYGQGMSVAALHALALRRCLAQGQAGLEQRFFRAAAAVIDAPWTLAAGNDRQMQPGGPHGGLVARLRSRWLRRVLQTAHHDAVVAERFLRVARLLAPPRTLLAPAVAGRVLLAGARRAAAPAVSGRLRAPPSARRSAP